jgi:membrane-associated protease RseP (regulator of RpoE activity)
MVTVVLTWAAAALAGDRPRPFSDEVFVAASSGPMLGVQVMELTPELRAHFGARDDEGVLVARVTDDSAAADAGVRVGDVIVAVGDAPIPDGWSLRSAVARSAGDDDVAIEVVRGGRSLTLKAALPDAPDASLASPVGPPSELWRWFGGSGVDDVEERLQRLEERLDALEGGGR